MNSNVNEIPKTIGYINHCFVDILKGFRIIISYSDYTGPSSVSHVQKSYALGKKDVEYKYHISIKKVKDKDSHFFLYEFNYFNYQTFHSYNNMFTIKNEGITHKIDHISLEALVHVNGKRKSWLDQHIY
ncbi:hypothetical protein [Clostridium sp. BSD9I1]|uniref:hypothetical protein n=1 Tax=Clostridium sp. BSD9I1 TaxID=2003589 RepID=UPI001648988B|nr:hypothetical protein [Clostridium sp. BSD9I1]